MHVPYTVCFMTKNVIPTLCDVRIRNFYMSEREQNYINKYVKKALRALKGWSRNVQHFSEVRIVVVGCH